MARIILIFGVLFSLTIAQAREPISDNKMYEIYSEFQYESEYEVLKMDDDGNNSKSKACHRYLFNIKTSYPGSSEVIEVTGRLYTPNPDKYPGVIPFVIQLPPTGGTNVLDKWMGGKLCKQNIAGFIIDNDFTGLEENETPPPVEDHDNSHRRTAAAVKASMAYAMDNPRYNGNKIGLIGVSLGGILGAMSYNVLDKISAAYLIVAGGDIPHIVAWSKEQRVSRLRKTRMKEEGFESIEEYEAWLRSHMELDPYDFARRVPTETVFMVMSDNDKNVPSSDQFLLHEGYGEPEHKVKSSSHSNTVIGELLWSSNRKKIAEWFEGRFALENPRLKGKGSDFKQIRQNYVENI